MITLQQRPNTPPPVNGPAAADGPVPLGPERRDDLARRLANILEGDVRFGLHDRMLYATDASIYQVEPLGVVVPSSVDDALRALEFCRGHGLPVLPRGGGTSLAGQCVNRAVVLDLSARCTALLGLDEPARTCRAEAGLTIDDLNDTIARTGLFFPPDPSTSRHATIGGSIGNNAAGSRSVKYGRTAENLLGVDVALADGRRVTLDEGAALRDPVAAQLTERVAAVVRTNAALIRERFPKTLRRNAGYALDMVLAALDASAGGYDKVNLAHLICGSEGTLATTLAAELRLHPVPRTRGLAVVSFATLAEAIDAVVPILGLGPSAVELLDDLIVGLARDNIEYRRYVDLLPTPPDGTPVEAVLYVEFSSEHAGDAGRDEIERGFAKLREMFGAHAVGAHTDAPSMANAWKLRKAGEPLLHAIPGERKPLGFVEDNAVPPERLAEFVRGFREIVESRGTKASYYAHASVGVLHVRPLLSLKDPDDRRKMEEIAAEAAALAKSVGGVMSGEHGDGRARGPLLEHYFGPELVRAFREIKAVFDPGNRLNPGNIVDPAPLGSIHEHTRVRPTPGAGNAGIEPTRTYFDYDDQTDFAHAVEMCNGAGVCRKKTGGVMCPSYMATLDERHSTRGRGNALRLAISGQLDLAGGHAAWNDPETLETLNLCLSCKACKSECPSNVDIARLKAEYQAQGYDRRGGPPLRALVFGSIHTLNRLASIAPGVTNFVNTLPPVRALLDASLGFHPRRSLPRWQRPLRSRWQRSDRAHDTRPSVVLYADTFTDHNEPEIGLAARRVLEAFGYRVELFRGTDAGRAAMSVGLLPKAAAAADRELARLVPVARDERTAAVLFTEPSVMSAVTDDWQRLKLVTPRADRRAVADRSRLVEQFLAERWDEHPMRPGFDPAAVPGEVLLHAHCHQKALWGAETSAGLLRRVFGDRLRTLDTTCCGMAGSFGYTKDRYDLSMKIGELGLFPAVREAGEGSALAAPGTSCRHQIHDGCGVRGLHPIELIDRALAGGA